MTRPRPRTTALGALLVLALGAVAGIAAREAAPRRALAAEPSAPAVQAPAGSAGGAPLSAQSVAQAEGFRDRLEAWTADMELVLPRLTEAAQPDQSEMLGKLAADIAALEPGELLELEATMSHHPGFWELPAFIHAVVDPSAPVPPFYADLVLVWEAGGEISAAEAAELLDRPVGSQRPPTSWTEPLPRATEGALPRLPGIALPQALEPAAVLTPNPTATAPYPTMPLFPPRGDLPEQPASRPNCPGPFEGNVCGACPDRIPLAAIFAISTALSVAERVKESFDPDQENCTCVFPAPIPVCTYLPNPVYYVANSIRIALDATKRGLEFANALSLECDNNLHKAITDLFLDATVSSRVTQASFDAHAMLMMQVEIEQNLQEQVDDRIGLFQLPQSICSVLPVPDDTATMTGFEGFRFCGKLELVRQIVADTIDRSAAADMLVDIAGARAELAAGDEHYMLGQWKSAYERYSKAYRAAVQQESRR